MANDLFGIREGEVAIALPGAFDAGIYFIGRISTPWTRREECPKNSRVSDAVCTIAVDARYAAALAGVESCSHLLVLYWMDKAPRNLVVQVPRHDGEQRGTFALRSPARPNPIAVSVAGSCISRATWSPWSASIVSTARRSSTSSPISPRPTPFRTP
jgi:tRNA-methyltransferase O